MPSLVCVGAGPAMIAALVTGLVAAGCARESNLPPPPPQVAPVASSSASSVKLPSTRFELSLLACQKGSSDGCNTAGALLADGSDGLTPDAARSESLFQRACDLGSAAGCGNLGALLRSRDELHAIGLLTRSCDASWWPGCYVLADIYATGDREDLPLAAALLTRACNGKHQPSCASLAILYQAGTGVPRNVTKARTLLEGACDADVDTGCAFLGNLLVSDDAHRAEETERARAAFEKGCTDAFPMGCYLFALACAKGFLGDAAVAQSVPLMRRACERGYGDACAVLATWTHDE
jgi:TPR repeat protein